MSVNEIRVGWAIMILLLAIGVFAVYKSDQDCQSKGGHTKTIYDYKGVATTICLSKDGRILD